PRTSGSSRSGSGRPMPSLRPDDRLAGWLVFHGAVTLFVGLAAGAPYHLALVHGWGDEPVRAWRLAHQAGPICGLMAVAIGAALPRLVLSRRAAALLTWSVVVSVDGFIVGMLLAALLGVRGLRPFQSPADAVVHACYQVGTWGGLLGSALLVRGAYA